MSDAIAVQRFYRAVDTRPRPQEGADLAEMCADVAALSTMLDEHHAAHREAHGCQGGACACGCQCAFHEIGGPCLGRRPIWEDPDPGMVPKVRIGWARCFCKGFVAP